jgi:hypothetical protein
MKRSSIVLLGLIVALSLVGWTRLQQSAKKAWDYKNLALITGTINAGWMEDGKRLPGDPSILTKSKELGEAGWELVSVAGVSENVVVYWFKKPK